MDSDFLELVQSAEGITVSQHSNCVLERAKNSLSLSLTRVRGIIRIFRVSPPTLAPTVFQPKRNSRCHLRRNPRRTFQQRQIETITILPKGMKPLSFLNLLTQQTKNGEQSLKLS
jgi:hypothetical protein